MVQQMLNICNGVTMLTDGPPVNEINCSQLPRKKGFFANVKAKMQH